MYFDGSGNNDDPVSKYVTLGGFAAEDDTWNYFETEWWKILRDRGNPSYSHMNEAIRHKDAFDGWSAEKTDFLYQGLLGLLTEVGQTRRFCAFRATVDLDAHRTWASVNNIPPIERLCADLAFFKLSSWYASFPTLVLGDIDIYFDRNEPYMNILMQAWNNKETIGKSPWWGLVRMIGPLEMQRTPGLQAADMIAWSHNRLKTHGDQGWAGRLATTLTNGTPCWHVDLTEKILRTRKIPKKNACGFYF